jgi:small subunit ribosomal protein S10e
MVQIQKQDKKRVYTYLLKEGVIVIQKDFSLDPHKATAVPNLQVWMLLRSLKDRGYVELIFNWQYFYYFLN